MGGTSYVNMLVTSHHLTCYLHAFYEDGDGMTSYKFTITWWSEGYIDDTIGDHEGEGLACLIFSISL
jgi:hypothetical protein